MTKLRIGSIVWGVRVYKGQLISGLKPLITTSNTSKQTGPSFCQKMGRAFSSH